MAYQAKRTNYKGMWFKSNLEAKTAEAFDRLGIRWEYESRCFRDYRYSGGQYTPDFWLPDVCAYIEVVGKLDQRHISNAWMFCHTQSVPMDEDWGDAKRPLYTEQHPMFAFLLGDGHLASPSRHHNGGLNYSIAISKCSNCGKPFIMDGEGLWSCSHCGGDYGQHHENYNLFWYAGMKHA